MKIQFFGGTDFRINNKKHSIHFNPSQAPTDSTDCVLVSNTENGQQFETAKKTFSLPGEFEISEILIRGFRSEDGTNTMFKALFEDTACVHFGNLTEIPATKQLELLGENIDVAFLCLSDKMNGKKAKELLEKTEPRLVLFGGDPQYFAEMSSLMNVKTAEENPLEVHKSKLPDENSELYILPV